MNVARLISLALFVVGILLIIFGINAADSFSSDVSNFFTGNPTDEAIWMLIGGVVLVAAGGFGTLRGSH